MYSISCQISRSKNRYMVFQHKLLFNLVKDFSNEPRVWGGVSLSKYSLIEKKFLTQRVSEKSTRYVVKIRALISLYSVSTQISFQPSRGLIQTNWGSRVESYCLSTVWERKNELCFVLIRLVLQKFLTIFELEPSEMTTCSLLDLQFSSIRVFILITGQYDFEYHRIKFLRLCWTFSVSSSGNYNRTSVRYQLKKGHGDWMLGGFGFLSI